ncbi:MAG: bifunctional riboflavin kinase/FAD synthetase [Oscillospiraceae bacterium]|nr:bifunctional riboflavin kinase/FAD synthetase [Oscillospiraceae bacterium]
MREKTIYALGFFDGVHLGHGALLAACRSLADRLGCKAGAVTFDNRPETLIRGVAPCLINTAAQRERLMKDQFHMDSVTVLPFDREMMSMPWQDFFRMLRETYAAAGIVCGHDYRFGYRGEGNAEKLLAACGEAGIPCVVIPEQTIDGRRVSSTYIRSQIEDGHMETAVRFLGHPHIVSGSVVHGHRLGRTLGIPTANLILPEGVVVPKFGVYACRCIVDGQSYAAVTNVGTRPTVSGSGITVEPWILDFDGDLYDREITLEFYKFLRPETKFAGLDALKAQIQADAVETRAYFGM